MERSDKFGLERSDKVGLEPSDKFGSERSDKFKDECGVIAVHNNAEASTLAYLGLPQLQHRGQESAGIVASDGGRMHVHKAMGLVADIFTEEVLGKLPGNLAIGHTRYSTTG